jgi:polysaccharide biosynthesis protein PslE
MSNQIAAGNPLRDVYQALVRHKRKSAWFFVTVVAGVVLLTFLSPKEYRSEGKLFMRLGRENATLDPTASLGQNPIVAVPQSRENEINSVVEILQSRVLLEKVVDGLGPAVILGAANPTASSDDAASGGDAGGWVQRAGAQIGQVFANAKHLLAQLGSSAGLDDRQRAILLLAKNVKAEAAKKSNVIEISYEGPSPEQCQAVVAKLIDSYLDEHLRLNRTRGSHEFFVDQTSRLRDELTSKEAELRDLKTRTGLASPSAQRQMIVARIGRIEDDLLDAEAAQAVAQAKVRNLREKLVSLPDTQVTAETSGFGNEGTDRMRDQFYALQVREKEAAAKYTDDHPKMRQVHEQVATARAVLDEEELGRKQVTKEPGRLHQQAQLALLAEEPVLASSRAQAQQLRTQLTDVRSELAALNENEMHIAALQRDIDLIEADYRKYSANLEQARIDQQMEVQRMSNIGIVQPASYEPRPVRPRKLLSLLLGIGAGLFGALALPLVLDQFDDTRPTARDVRGQSQLSTLASIPHISARHMAGEPRRAPR